MELQEKKPVAVYVRVSTLDQTTLNQELILKEFCEKNNLEIYKIYKEEGVSGAKFSRPVLDMMMQDMRAGKFSAIVVWKLDRLGRSLQHLLQILQELQKRNVRLIITDMNLDTSTPQGKLWFSVVGAFAEFERSLIIERIRAGIARRKKEGKFLGRPAGAKDKSKRRKSGYLLRWAKERQEQNAKETGVIDDINKFIK